MSQHDFNIANQGFPATRADLNNALAALASNSAGTTEPTTTYAYQYWYDETTNLLKMRNGADDAWITLAFFDQTNDEWEVRTAVIQAVDSAGVVIKTDDGTTRLTIADDGTVTVANNLAVTGTTTLTGDVDIADKIVHTGDTNTAIRFPAADTVTVETGGSERVRVDSSGNVGIGVTPSSWGSNAKALELGTSGSALWTFTPNRNIHLVSNAYFDNTNYKYVGSSFATNFQSRASDGTYLIQTAPSGTAGNNISFTTQMSLSNTGDLAFNSGYGSAATAYGCRAWVNFDGDPVTIRDSGNVSSITDNGAGDYTLNFSTALVDNDYAVVGTSRSGGSTTRGGNTLSLKNDTTLSTTSCRVDQRFGSSSTADGGRNDVDTNCVAIFR